MKTTALISKIGSGLLLALSFTGGMTSQALAEGQDFTDRAQIAKQVSLVRRQLKNPYCVYSGIVGDKKAQGFKATGGFLSELYLDEEDRGITVTAVYSISKQVWVDPNHCLIMADDCSYQGCMGCSLWEPKYLAPREVEVYRNEFFCASK